MSRIKNCSEQEFENEVINQKVPVLVDFWAEW
jgi:thioredoxin-like negative regulator of GroEL